MKPLQSQQAEFFVPDGRPIEAALARTTHLAVGAHQDDLEIMAIDGILQCFQRNDRWFTGIVVTDGAGSPRAGVYANYSDDDMRRVRVQEQKKAAQLGEYGALALLGYSSAVVKAEGESGPTQDLRTLLEVARPETVYLHNLADKHPTHVAVALRAIAALRALPREARPQRVYGCEVWRSLDWMLDGDKIVFDTSPWENLQLALLGVFDSQISGGKRYDLAAMARRRANATYFESHGVDTASAMAYGMDLTPLIEDPARDIRGYVLDFIQRFADDVGMALTKATPTGRGAGGPDGV
ncbi:MAG TPA: PIG-L family deacetylase [Anaerolineales bacterium]|nr:PIG-L family deacetylase [Anaerolineales bacterium]